MNKRMILTLTFIILMANFLSASNYYIEFNQREDLTIVKEKFGEFNEEYYADFGDFVSSRKNTYFLKKIIFPEDFGIAEIVLNLDKGIVVRDKDIFPEGYSLKTDGEIISISWTLNNVVKGESFAIFVNLDDTTKSNLFYFGLFVFLLFLGIIFVVVYYFKRKPKLKKPKLKNKRKKSKKEGYSYLLDSEKKIIEFLKKADRNELWQKQIQKSTGFSKAKVSRVIRNLEARGLIKKIPFGNAYKIRLI